MVYGLASPRFLLKLYLEVRGDGGISLNPCGIENWLSVCWRSLVAAELVLGVSSGEGGLRWFIFESSNLLEIPNVFVSLLTAILICLAHENLILCTIERYTMLRRGLQSRYDDTQNTPGPSFRPLVYA